MNALHPGLFRRAIVLLTCCVAALPAAEAASVRLGALRCEHLDNPAGIDAPKPRLSWVLEPTRRSARGQRQTAYQVLVASSTQHLAADIGDLWDSGKVRSDQSVLVPYGGRPLVSAQECFWKVRVWDESGKASGWSDTGYWSMGLLQPADWQGQWIGRDEPERDLVLTNTSWIWFPEGRADRSAPVATRYFRRGFELEAGRPIQSALWLVAADNQFTAYVNGKQVGTGGSYKAATQLDLREALRPGRNVLAVSVRNVGDGPNPAGLLGLLKIEFEQGEPLTVVTDETWRSTAEEFPGWEGSRFDDTTWLSSRVLGAAGMEPWGQVSGPEDRRLPARWLRKEFAVQKKVRRATVWMSGLGSSELYLNGKKVGDQVLSPGLTEYDKRVFYVTHEVGGLLRRGPNAVGVVLGNGRFFAPRHKTPMETRTYGFPKLLFQMRIEYQDGSQTTIVSDPSWRLTTNGPIRANCEYDGEEYDARLELGRWNEAGYDDAAWEKAAPVGAPGGALAAQMIRPIRITQTLRPIGLSQPQPGVYIFDLGQNMVGWCRLRVSGPAGTTVTLRHAETLKPDGTLYLDNIRGAKVTDTYTLKGQGRELYEPRFTYHGFRFVEVKGYPGKPSLASLEGCVVHDDLEIAGEFACSEPLLNRIHTNIRWGVRGNYRSIPTDCPQRDERQGWLGDRSAESKGETYLFHTAALYRKWLGDMADAQKESGSVPDVCPSYWPIYSDNVTWPSSTVIIPGSLFEQYGDLEILARHYDSAKKWMNYMSGFVTNGIISRDSYGDWCVPPEDPKLIHSNDPARKTDKALLATAYFYHDARLMARYAARLNRGADVQAFDNLAERLKQAFNAKFYRTAEGYYDNGSQTSCVLPLAFGLAPEGERERVFQHLVRKITQESRNHIGTGLIGGQWLMRVLSDNGRADLAFAIATQRDYPSWGYMVQKGATTIWELWNGDTADPAMNSGNHVMLVGDLGIWLYEYLAGIRPDPQQPGFKHIILRPEVVPGLDAARAIHRSPYGSILSDWKREGESFLWNLSVPPNTTATVYLPADDSISAREAARPLEGRPGIRITGLDRGRVILELAPGQYRFHSRLARTPGG